MPPDRVEPEEFAAQTKREAVRAALSFVERQIKWRTDLLELYSGEVSALERQRKDLLAKHPDLLAVPQPDRGAHPQEAMAAD